jgi:hypothetical protein
VNDESNNIIAYFFAWNLTSRCEFLIINIPAAIFVENGNENEDMTDDVVLQQCRYFISTVKGKSSKCNKHAMHSWWTIKSYKDMHM